MEKMLGDLINRVGKMLLFRNIRVTGVTVILAVASAFITDIHYSALDRISTSTGNPSWFYIFVAMAAGVFGWLLLFVYLNRYRESSTVKCNDFQLFLLICWPGVVIFCFGSFLFFDGETEKWIINSKVGRQRSVFVLPFISDIRKVSISQDASTEIVAITKDGIRIRAHVHAELKLTADDATVLRVVQGWVNPNNRIHQEVVREMQRKFREVALRHDLKDINDLMVDWETGSAISESFLSSLGLEWDGALSVSSVRVWFGKDANA